MKNGYFFKGLSWEQEQRLMTWLSVLTYIGLATWVFSLK